LTPADASLAVEVIMPPLDVIMVSRSYCYSCISRVPLHMKSLGVACVHVESTVAHFNSVIHHIYIPMAGGSQRIVLAGFLVETSEDSNPNLRSAWYVVETLPCQFYELILGLRQAGAFHTLFNSPPSAVRVQHWHDKTSQPFEYSVDGNGALNKTTIQCHHSGCSSSARVGKPLS